MHDGDGEQDATTQTGGTETSADPQNTGGGIAVSEGTEEAPLTKDELLAAIEARLTELGRPDGSPNAPVTAEEVEWITLQNQWFVLTEYDHVGSYVDFVQEQMTADGYNYNFADVSPFEQRALLGNYRDAFHTEAGRLGPLGVVDETLAELGVPWWARLLISRRPSTRRNPGNGERVNGNNGNRRNPCRR